MRSSRSTFTCTNKQTHIHTHISTTIIPSLLQVARQKHSKTHPHLALSRTEVEVQTSLKPLFDEGQIGRHFTQGVVPSKLRDKMTT